MGTLTWKLSGGASTPHDGFANETLNTFEYNGFGLRVEKTDSLGTASFLTDGLTVASPVLNDGSAEYTYGPGLASERRGNATRAYHLDGLGSTRLMTDSSQAVTNSLAYDAFGNTLSGTAATPLKYAGSWGYQSDVDNGLMLLGHRYYDPALGRFLAPDPIKDGSNWYAYCDNNPLGSVDPEGLDTFVFDGQKLKQYEDEGPNRGRLIDWWPAYSGPPGSTRADQKKRGGPIPEGRYRIRPSDDQFRSRNPISVWQKWRFPWDEYEPWGDRRIPVDPEPGTDQHGRSGGFFIHGGRFIGSLGCIDVGPNDVQIIDWIGQQTKDQTLIVDYSGWTTKVPAKPRTGEQLPWPVPR